MLFFDLTFVVLFLPGLVAVLLLWRRFLPQRPALEIGIAASLLFLAANGIVTVVVVAVSVVANYAVARNLQRRRSRRLLAAGIAGNLLVLFYFKYSLFAAGVLGGAGADLAWSAALPLGLSFYTFQKIAFLVDAHRGRLSAFGPRSFAFFVFFFPQFIAGPIVAYERVALAIRRFPSFNARSIRFGLTLFLIGLLKKLAADQFAPLADFAFGNAEAIGTVWAWTGLLAFSLQIYLDFSGYSDMAVGLGRLFGVGLPYNFASPYRAASLQSFWRRWHMTLSRWLRDLVYIPLGGNRHGAWRAAAAVVTTMALGGLWHGANWTFLVWGLVHGIGLVAARRLPAVPLPVAAKVGITFLFVTLAWVLFRAPDLDAAWTYYGDLLSWSGQPNLGALVQPTVLQSVGIAAGLVACFAAPNSQTIALWISARRVHALALSEWPVLYAATIVSCLAFITPAVSTSFIYFRF